jgi:hypothetical protein
VLTLAEATKIMEREKTLFSKMEWATKRGKTEFAWSEAKITLQFADELEVPEQFYLSCQWRPKGQNVPEMWTFGMIYQGDHLYAIHKHPLSKHTNHVGQGRPLFKKEVIGNHQHTWSEGGTGYIEPLNLPDDPEIIWRMFLKRANIIGPADFCYPEDQHRLI